MGRAAAHEVSAQLRAHGLDGATPALIVANASLPDEAKGQLDKLMVDVAANPKAVVFEIEGHTDSSGGTALNEQIGLDRAEAVQRYLHEQHKVPLHKMNVISYGEDKPVAENKTRDGRAQNRRVVLRVLV